MERRQTEGTLALSDLGSKSALPALEAGLYSRDTGELRSKNPRVKQASVGFTQQVTTLRCVSHRAERRPGASKEAGELTNTAGRLASWSYVTGQLPSAAHLLHWAFCWLSRHGLKTTNLEDLQPGHAYFESLSCNSPMKTWNKIPSRRRKHASAWLPLLFLTQHKGSINYHLRSTPGEFTSNH